MMQVRRLRLLPRNIVLGLALLLSGFSPAADAALLGKIMPLGDSITFGTYRGSTNVPGGYRDSLYADLTPDHTFQFVGSQTTNPSPVLTAAGQAAHQGHPGFAIQAMIDNVDGWLAAQPDYVLLHIGTNDIYNKHYWNLGGPLGTGGSDTSHMQSRLRTLIDKIVTARPTAQLIVSNLVPIGLNANAGANLYVKDFNAAIENTIVPDYIAQGKLVSFVDNYSSFLDSNGNTNSVWALSDPDWHIHPDQTGYDLIGGNFAAAIEALNTVDPHAQSVPEPTTFALLAIALASLITWVKFKIIRAPAAPGR